MHQLVNKYDFDNTKMYGTNVKIVYLLIVSERMKMASLSRNM